MATRTKPKWLPSILLLRLFVNNLNSAGDNYTRNHRDAHKVRASLSPYTLSPIGITGSGPLGVTIVERGYKRTLNGGWFTLALGQDRDIQLVGRQDSWNLGREYRRNNLTLDMLESGRGRMVSPSLRLAQPMCHTIERACF